MPLAPGRTLNIDKVGVSCTNGGSFYNKRERGFLQVTVPPPLSDPVPCPPPPVPPVLSCPPMLLFFLPGCPSTVLSRTAGPPFSLSPLLPCCFHAQDHRPFMLSVEDPNDKENDLARNSYHVQLVSECWGGGGRGVQ